MLLAACGDDEPPELTIEERLATVEGRTLTAVEVEEQLALGATLCRMDETILDAVWFKLSDDQLEFQDVVFGHLCPERSVFYAGRTGRFVTEEAEGSGVVTSTTRPATTEATALSTSARATIAPAPSSPPGQPETTQTTGPATDSSAGESSPTTDPSPTSAAVPSTTADPGQSG